MSWVYHLAGDANADLRSFSPEVQELIFDELESILKAPERSGTGLPIEIFIHPVNARQSGRSWQIGVMISKNSLTRSISVLGVRELKI